MKIVIFGASGSTGQELVRQALEKGYGVTAFVRDPAKLDIRNPGLRIVQGDVADDNAVSDAVQQGQPVLSALGAASPFKKDQALIRGVRNIVKVMEIKHALRIVYLSFAGVPDSRDQLGGVFRWLIVPTLSRVAADHLEKEKVIMKSHLQWTVVRPALLTNGRYTGSLHSGERLEPRLWDLPVSRADVAAFMLQQLTENTYLKKAPVLSRG